MSKIDELIINLCPNGVIFRRLEEMSSFERGKGFKKEDKGTGSSPIIFYGELYTTYGNYINEIVSFVNESKVSNRVYANKGDIVLPISSTTAEAQIGKASVVNIDNVILGSDAIVIHHNINPSYLMYYMNSKIFEFDKMRCVSGTTIRHLSPKEMMQIKIAIPPLKIQDEIVKILDNFIKLSDELTTEMKARQKQFEYYQIKLFDFSNNIEYLPLEKIAEIGTGSSNTNESVEDGKYPFYVRSQQLYRKNTFEYDETSIITSGDGVGVGKIFHYVEGKYALHQRAYRIHITNEKVIPKYFYYYMKSTFYDYIMKNAFNSSVTSVRRPMLNRYPVPIPSIKEQEKIIKILDNFEKICNSSSIGLPAEIEARQKQFEYYSNKLLTFKELVDEG